jgi:hypothetical protein
MIMLNEIIPMRSSAEHLKGEGLIEVTGRLHQPVDRKLGYLGRDRFVFFRFAPDCDAAIWNDGRSSGFGYGAWVAFDEVLPVGRDFGVEFGVGRGRGEAVLLVDRKESRVFIGERGSAEELVERQHEDGEEEAKGWREKYC